MYLYKVAESVYDKKIKGRKSKAEQMREGKMSPAAREHARRESFKESKKIGGHKPGTGFVLVDEPTPSAKNSLLDTLKYTQNENIELKNQADKIADELAKATQLHQQEIDEAQRRMGMLNEGYTQTANRLNEVANQAEHYQNKYELTKERLGKVINAAKGYKQQAQELEGTLGKYKKALPLAALATLGLGAGGGYYIGSRNNQQ